MEKISILIVEDEHLVATDMQSLLRNMGFDVIGVASTGEEALRLAESERPDLVLMDIVLQGALNGIQTAELIKRTTGTPVIYLTAHADANTVRHAHGTEPYGYIFKPINPHSLYAGIDTALSRCRLETRLREGEEKYRNMSQGLLDSLSGSKTLFSRYRHRVKNNLNVILSLIDLQKSGETDNAARSALLRSYSRIFAISMVYGLSRGKDDGELIDCSTYIRSLVGHMDAVYADPASSVEVRVEANGMRIDEARATPCGILIGEILANAYQHAFHGRERGEIVVTMREAGQVISLQICDNGVGLPAGINPAESQTLGFKLILSLVKQLRGEIAYRNENGLRYDIQFPGERTVSP